MTFLVLNALAQHHWDWFTANSFSRQKISNDTTLRNLVLINFLHQFHSHVCPIALLQFFQPYAEELLKLVIFAPEKNNQSSNHSIQSRDSWDIAMGLHVTKIIKPLETIGCCKSVSYLPRQRHNSNSRTRVNN